MPGSAQSIAAGFACGAAISFTPFVGFHFILAAIFALLIRANILASAIGTAIGNPWSFPFIWIWIYELGHMMGAGGSHQEKSDLDFVGLFSSMMEAILRLDFAFLLETVLPVWWPMMVGSIPTTVAVWVLFYLMLKPVVATYQSRRARRIRRRIQKDLENRQ